MAMTTSINTNASAALAVEILNSTSSQLQATQKQISTGYRVADATDDGAAFAVAQRVRSDVSALTTANQQLGNTTGILGTTTSALTSISNTLASARDVLVELSSNGNQGSTRAQYVLQYQTLIANVKGDLQDASYVGKTLIGNLTGSNGSFGGVTVIRNETGSSYSITSFSGSAFLGSISFTSTQLNGASTVAALISTTGTFIKQQNSIGTELNVYGQATNYVSNQVSYNSNKIDALNAGLGALVDANLTQESAQLTALQVRQQLATQSLSIANQAPQSLLKLFQ